MHTTIRHSHSVTASPVVGEQKTPVKEPGNFHSEMKKYATGQKIKNTPKKTREVWFIQLITIKSLTLFDCYAMRLRGVLI